MPASLRVTVFQSGEAWREATPPVLLPLLLLLSAVRGKGLLVVVVVVGWLGGEEGGGTYWHGLRMFSEARGSGSVARYDAEKCLAA